MKYEYCFSIVSKLNRWAGSLSSNIDFIDYWYNLALSKTKACIDSDVMHRINAFDCTIWQENFEEFVDRYAPHEGEGYDTDTRSFFARYMQYLIYAFQIPSRPIAEFYGISGYQRILLGMPRYHCFSSDAFVQEVVDRYGIPPGVTQVEIVGV